VRSVLASRPLRRAPRQRAVAVPPLRRRSAASAAGRPAAAASWLRAARRPLPPAPARHARRLAGLPRGLVGAGRHLRVVPDRHRLPTPPAGALARRGRRPRVRGSPAWRRSPAGSSRCRVLRG